MTSLWSYFWNFVRITRLCSILMLILLSYLHFEHLLLDNKEKPKKWRVVLNSLPFLFLVPSDPPFHGAFEKSTSPCILNIFSAPRKSRKCNHLHYLAMCALQSWLLLALMEYEFLKIPNTWPNQLVTLALHTI